VIDEKQIGWAREFLHDLCNTSVERQEVDAIINTFRKLWVVVKASEQNPYPRSPRLEEALKAIKGQKRE